MKKGKKLRPWTAKDEEILIENVKKNVTNLKKAFTLTGQIIKRSPGAVASHWYANTSIKSGHCLFVTVSGQHIAINRKNGKGKRSPISFFRKVLAIFGLKE